MNGPIRILQVFAKMNSGGAETLIMNLYRNIDRSKVQFDFVVHTEKKCDYDDEIKSLGGSIYRVPRYTGKNHFQYKKVWHAFFKKYPQYKIIHGHIGSTASIYLKIAKKYGLTTIAHSHSTSSGNGFSAIIKNVLQYPIRNIADYLLTCSKPAGEWLFGKKACNSNNFFILKNAVDAKQFIFNKNIRLEKRKELQIEDKFVIGHVGSFRPPKNHEFLIDIFKEIHDKHNNAVLLLVGDGELRQSIENKVNKLGLSDSVIFTGVRSDIPGLLQAMDIFVFPSLYEGLGIAVVEAQAAGLNCIVSDQIPDEAIITNLVEKVPLSKSPSYWSELAIEKINYQRKDTYDLIKAAGYDIKETTKLLENFYIGLI